MKRYLWGFLSLAHIGLYAQNNPAVKNTQTDKTYANTTEIYKAKAATDEQVLNEITGDYGLGDVVRISDAPPPKPAIIPSSAPQKEEVKPQQPLKEVKITTIETPRTESTPKAVLISNKMPADPSNTEGVSAAVAKNATTVKKERTTTEHKASTSAKSSSRSSKNYTSSRKSSYKKSSLFSMFKSSKTKKPKRRVPKNNGKMGCYKF